MKNKDGVCPTCGCSVRVVGKTTKHYEPVVDEEVLLAKFDKGMRGGEMLAAMAIKRLIDNYLEKIK